jgi:membrane-associated phospholipid phosphatase
MGLTAPAQNLDIDMLKVIHTPAPLASDPYMSFISDSHYAVCVGVPLGLGLAGLIERDEALVMNAVEVGVASAINLGLTHLVKNSLNRTRPYDTYPGLIMKKSDGGSGSFPSGHTSAAFATATSLSLNVPKWYVVVPAYTWASAVGYSRMHLGVHYPSDVLAGALLGAGSAWVTYKLNQWLQQTYLKSDGFLFH